MSPTTHRTVKTLLAVACAFAGVSTAPALAAPDTSNAQSEQTRDVTAMLDRASTMIADGKLIQGRAMLLALQDSPMGAAMGDAEGQRLWDQLAGVSRKIRQTNRYDIFIQKAEYALLTDNLVEADRQSTAVKTSPKSTSDQLARADAVLELVQMRRHEVSALLPNAFENLAASFNSSQYAKAKSIVERIGRIGADLTPEQTKKLARYRRRLNAIEDSGSLAISTASPAMGMLAPESGMNSQWLMENTEKPQDTGRTGSYLGDPEDEPIEIEFIEINPTTVEDATTESTSVSDGVQQETMVNDHAPVDLMDTARQFEAQSLLGEAHRAYEERRLGLALDKYTTALDRFGAYLSAADRQLAQQRRSDIQIELGTSGGPEGNLLQDTIDGTALELQRAEATFANLMQQSRDALASGDPQAAKGFTAQATLTIKNARNAMSESHYEQRLSEIDDLVSTINSEEEGIRIRTAEADETKRLEQTRELEDSRRTERDSKIIANINRVRALQQELKYEEALEVVDSILFLDPANPVGLLLKDIIEDTILYRAYAEADSRMRAGLLGQNLANKQAMIIPERIVGYPDDWPAITFRRGDALEFAESEANRSVLTTMQDTRMPVEFSDNALEDVVAFIGSTTQLDIDVD
ncbi:MAG: hypothetical protein JKY96_05415 [Phycisphaerales bacterium]|nr:hypothetical protein [Phycisphaerales bacterium]